jgi:hypothetical protein
MSPYILLSDKARSRSISTSDKKPWFTSVASSSPSSSEQKSASAALDDFLSYAKQLYTKPTCNSDALLSPATTRPLRRHSSIEGLAPNSVKEAIDFAILRSNLSSASQDEIAQSSNRYTIARGGQLVSVITVMRPAYRLGETITGTIDFTPPKLEDEALTHHIPTYGINVWLETTEQVDPSLALRSSSSIQRATRKVHAHVGESVLFARKISYRLEIPTTATPTFETTGVQLTWKIRVEFMTARVRPKIVQGLGIDEMDDGGGGGGEAEEAVVADDALLEQVSRDERGVVRIAKERLVAETFEVAVPIRVYGVAGTENDGHEAETDGLEV